MKLIRIFLMNFFMATFLIGTIALHSLGSFINGVCFMCFQTGSKTNKKTPSEVSLQKGFWLFYQFTVFVVKVIFEIRISIPRLDFYPFFVLQKPFGAHAWETFG